MPDPLSSDLPLDPEPVIGWRVWRLSRVAGRLRLVSLTRDDAWPPGEPMRARCAIHRGPVPSPTCSCGVYAASGPEALAEASVFSFDVGVVGPIAMWGTVIEHTSGARSAAAYPARLRLACSRCLADGRGAVDPVWVVREGSTLVPVCRDHAVAASGERSDAREVQSELLSTYGVDLQPIERLAALVRPVRRPGTPPRSEGLLITLLSLVIKAIGVVVQAFIAFLVLSSVLSFSFGVLGAIADVVTGGDEVTTVASASSPRPPHVVPASDADGRNEARPVVASHEPLPPFPSIEIPCGVGEGRSIRLVDCGDPAADLFGFAVDEPPAGAAHDCVPGWIAYSRGDDHWICWDAMPWADPDVRRWATAPDPFARRVLHAT